ncbi:MAG: AmmeMemoRadiSam system radical SAM enzyme [Lachnospiraceae bacterium]|nr:AmmeMemoRadiSam system radical SAM enzyme [Lachnospiraceae bacterium]
MTKCDVCFRHCNIEEGKLGFCGARTCIDGKVIQANYGRITSLALDPIEKKPLNRFYPGSLILSAGSYGCNLRCPFCQNYEISWSEEAWKFAKTADVCTPENLARTAAYYQNQGNIGIAFTYNEPLIGYEFILDTAKLIKELGMKTVLVTNGPAELTVLEKLAPDIDAMNIDLKGFTDRYDREVLKGDRKMVMDFIARAAQICHVEVTTLIIPGENDSEEEMDTLSSWIAGLTDKHGKRIGQTIPLHISRFFPRFHMQDRRATEVRLVYRLAEVARRNLTYVYTGNC